MDSLFFIKYYITKKNIYQSPLLIFNHINLIYYKLKNGKSKYK